MRNKILIIFSYKHNLNRTKTKLPLEMGCTWKRGPGSKTEKEKKNPQKHVKEEKQ